MENGELTATGINPPLLFFVLARREYATQVVAPDKGQELAVQPLLEPKTRLFDDGCG
jgi:hypothetical protein